MSILNLSSYETALSGGKPNSLGNTVAVVEDILKNTNRITELFDCYFCDDELVRLRVSNAFKRVAKKKPEIVVPLLDQFISKVSKIDQASTQWTFAQLFLILNSYVTPKQKDAVTKMVQHNLITSEDWIVLNCSMELLSKYTLKDKKLRDWLLPHLAELSKNSHKSVAGRSKKYLELLYTK